MHCKHLYFFGFSCSLTCWLWCNSCNEYNFTNLQSCKCVSQWQYWSLKFLLNFRVCVFVCVCVRLCFSHLKVTFLFADWLKERVRLRSRLPSQVWLSREGCRAQGPLHPELLCPSPSGSHRLYFLSGSEWQGQVSDSWPGKPRSPNPRTPAESELSTLVLTFVRSDQDRMVRRATRLRGHTWIISGARQEPPRAMWLGLARISPESRLPAEKPGGGLCTCCDNSFLTGSCRSHQVCPREPV